MKLKGEGRQRGIAMVELTIVLPLLLLLMLAAAEFGRALFQYNTLTKAVRDGARYYAKYAYLGKTMTLDPNAQTTAKYLIVYGNSGGVGEPLLPGFTTVDVSTSTSTDATGNYVTVSATYDFNFVPGNPLSRIIGLLDGSFADSLPLTATVTMRAL